MSLNTYPYNPFPASTDKLDEAHNAELQQEVDQLKEDTGELQEDVEKLETDKTDNAVIAPEFDAEAGVYAVGDLVIYQGKLYEFTTAHETAGDWDPTEVTEKTVADELSSLESGLTNLTDDVKLNTQDLTTPSRTKNLLNYDEWKKVNIIGGSGVFENNGITLTATDDCYTGYNNTDFPVNARIPISEGETITLSWQANNDLSGTQYIFPNGGVSGAVSKNNANGKSLSYTAGSGVTYVTFRFGVGDVGNSIEYSNIQIEKGNTATTFAPYIPSVESRIEAVESGLTNVTKSGGGSRVDIGSATSQNPYTFLTDGYVQISCDSSSSGNVSIYGSNDGSLCTIGASNGNNAVFVRAGMVCTCESVSGTPAFRFIPIV